MFDKKLSRLVISSGFFGLAFLPCLRVIFTAIKSLNGGHWQQKEMALGLVAILSLLFLGRHILKAWGELEQVLVKAEA